MHNKLIQEIIQNVIIRMTFSNPFKKSNEFKKIVVDKLDDEYRVSKYTSTQVFHQNLKDDDIHNFLAECFTTFKQCDGKVIKGNYNIRVNKKGNVLRRFTEQQNTNMLQHDRSKNYILDHYADMPILKELKIVSHDNQIRNDMFDKFKQINKYVELVDDLIKKDNPKKLKIVDFGSGKSYLTFVLYEYLHFQKGIELEMIGIDLKEQVILDNQALAKRFGYEHLSFIAKDINEIKMNDVDMMISLHACDVATDLALNKALEWKCKYIIAVPCCHNEVYRQMKSDVFSKMIDHNIIKERLSSLVTDTVRVNVLQYRGYQTQIIEYVDSDHSLKNLMIRARLTHHYDEAALASIHELKTTYQFEHTLLQLQNIK
ncbi:MAG: SAM-dependent methyltransferase [Erysipelothrix sp.]|nr:SAM-dependent methyltransferase [Erysipelothrix sp.]